MSTPLVYKTKYFLQYLILIMLLSGCAADVGNKGDLEKTNSSLSAENAALRVKLSSATSDLDSCQKYYKQKPSQRGE